MTETIEITSAAQVQTPLTWQPEVPKEMWVILPHRTKLSIRDEGAALRGQGRIFLRGLFVSDEYVTGGIRGAAVTAPGKFADMLEEIAAALRQGVVFTDS